MNSEVAGAQSWYVAMRRISMIALIYCALILVLLGINALIARRSDPLTPARLNSLQLELNRHPKDKKLLAGVRHLDAQVRTAYFRNREFALRGFYLLLGGVSLFLLASGISRQCRPRLPEPNSQASEENFAALAGAQRGVLAMGALLFGALSIIAVFSRHDSTAEYAKRALLGTNHSRAQTVAAPAATMAVATLSTAPSVAPLAAAAAAAAAADSTHSSAPPLAAAPLSSPLAAPAAALPAPIKSLPISAPVQPLKAVPVQPNEVEKSPAGRSVVGKSLKVEPLHVSRPVKATKPTAAALRLNSRLQILKTPLVAFMAGNEAAQWPRFRGPSGDGNAPGSAPLNWNGASGEGILWKAEVPLEGWNSPVVWEQKVFLSGASKTASEVFCYDSRSGALLWRKPVPISKEREAKLSPDTGFAPSTLATDGQRVCALFVNGDLACFDVDGKLLWQRVLGRPENEYGHASSPVIYGNSLILQWDQGNENDKKSALLSFDLSNGKMIWKTPRPVGSSWATPLLVRDDTRDEIIACSSPFVMAYDAQNGVEIWRAKCLSGDVTPSPILAGGFIIACAPYDNVLALQTGAPAKVIWESRDCTPDIVSPAAGSELLYLVSEGYVVALSIKDGAKVWDHNFSASIHASPIVADGRVYLLDAQGVMHVIADGRQFKLLAENPLGEATGASPALSNGRMFIRGNKHLFCLGGAS